MEFKVLFLAAAIFFICPPQLAAAAECRDPVTFNFGDSNSDTGGYAVAYGRIFGYPFGSKFFNRSSDRLSHGHLIIVFLCENVKADLMSSYMESLTPNFKYGVNFAVGGMKDMFDDDDFENALYMIDIGQNDITDTFLWSSRHQVIEQIPSYIAGIKEAIQAIYEVGGRKFWVHNTGPAGCLLYMLAKIKVGDPRAEFDKAGCLKQLNEVASEFNAQLRYLSEDLRVELKNARVVYVDMYTIKYDVISNSALYGFENPLMACCGVGGAPYKANLLCGKNGFTACDEDTNYINWDGIHYTDNANGVFAARVATTNYSTPPLKFESVWC